LNEHYAVTNEKINSGETKNKRIESEISELKTAIENLTEQTKGTDSKIERLEEELAAKELDLGQLMEIQDSASRMVANRRNELTAKNEEIINIRNRMDAIRSNRERSESRKKFLREKIDENHAEIRKNESGIKQLESDIYENEVRLAAMREDYKKRESELISYKNMREELNQSIENIKQKLVDKRVVIARRNSEHEFLSNLAVDDNAANTIMKHKQWKADGRNFLIELINTDEEYKPAIEAALGTYGNVILVDSYDEVKKALNILNEENLGKAGFICRDKIPSIEFTNKKEIESAGIISHISELEGIDEDIRNILRLLLENVVLARDLESAEKYVSTHAGSRAVTLRGEVIDSSGFIRGGSLSAKEGINVGKSKKLKKLELELKKLMEELRTDEEELIRLQKELANYNVERF